MTRIKVNEEQRLTLQEKLDRQKTQAERNRLGQFATPTALAREILQYGIQLLPKDEPVRFLDPAIGTGSFYSALRETAAADRIEAAGGYEVDSFYGEPAKSLWSETSLKIHIEDFTRAQPPANEAGKYNLLVCNPPYVRHHHIINGQKTRLQDRAEQTCGVRFNGLAGLYCYFVGLAHEWMREDGAAGWLIPSEFMDVNYGRALKSYLLNRVTLLRIHRFDPNEVQFRDALVSSALVWFRKKKPAAEYDIEFTFGGSLTEPKESRLIPAKTLRHKDKWTGFPVREAKESASTITLSSLFTVKRGLATGDNKFFILSKEQISGNGLPMQFFRPILPGPRYLQADEIPADASGNPDISPQLFLLDCPLTEEQLAAQYPTLWKYLQSGKPSVSGRYLCSRRAPWYSQEKRPPSPFICTYMGRGNLKKNRPFRFILNHSKATAANVYLLLYPKPFLANALSRDPGLAKKIWQLLNKISSEVLLAGGRVYGGGLYKLEPKELGNIPAGELLDFVPQALRQVPVQRELFKSFV
ncbi:MAG: Eco57I restriction-modification methylase domain-containing protein [Candidatus Aminicenantes bacterium]|nr:Eco57I restriction-modification methylase domain-containing protein [Candidatus Aminicenantes bacterium]